MSSTPWELSEAQRQATIRRTAENLFVLAYSRNEKISDKEARSRAESLESKAYTVARIESRTTSGNRPDADCVKAYARKLASLMIEFLSPDAETNQPASISATDEELVLGGAREFMTEESAKDQLAPMLDGHHAIKRIKLSTKSFGNDSANVVATAFEAQKNSLVDVDISDVIAGRPESEALATLKILCDAAGRLNLQRVDLSDNALGEKGLRACASAIQDQEELQHIALRNVGCSINACNALKQLLNRSEKLSSIHLYNNMSGDEGAVAIAEILGRSPQMTDFKMVSSRVGAEGGIALSKGLQAGQNLVRLELSDNPMTAEIATELAQTIRSQPHLKALILNDISLCGDEDTEGLKQICEALAASAPDLEELELALNEITAEGAKMLGAVLAQKSNLRRLILRENELENEGAWHIAQGIKHLTKLEVLDLSENQIKKTGAVSLVKGLAASKGSLKSLELDGNEINEEGLEAIKAILNDWNLPNVLGSLDENEGEEDDDGELPEEDDQSELIEAFAKTGVN